MDASGEKLSVKICGLTGGHSGAEIDKNRASANILMGQFLYELGAVCGYALAELEGGQKDNAIPRECQASILVLPEEVSAVTSLAEKMQKDFREEYTGSDENITHPGNKRRGSRRHRPSPNQPGESNFLPDEPALWREKNERHP